MSVSDPSSSKALTDLKGFPVRFLTISKNGLMSFSFDGELYTLKSGEAPQKVEISLATQAITNPDNFISINGGVSEMSLSPDGKEIAFIARGEVFVTAVDGSLPSALRKHPNKSVL